MLRKLIVALLAVLFVFSSSVYAGETMDNIKEKLHDGAVNVFTGWMEVPMQVRKGFDQGFKDDPNNKVMGVVTGTVEGIAAGYGRTVAGVVDVIGCWALAPASNEGVGIPTEGETVWDEGVAYDLQNPSAQEATINPISEKLARGAANLLLGVLEIPGQIVKGVKEGSFGWGIDKALIYFLSREISGVKDLATVCVPTPRKVTGATFDSKWPWTDLCDNIK